MERKSVSGAIRNKERSKKKFLKAVGKILKTKGFAGLKVNDIALVAGVDKKMIYTYFGGMDGLMDEYIRTQDFWSNVEEEKAKEFEDDGGKSFTKEMMISQFDYVSQNKELQKLLLWRLSEERKTLRKLTESQEENGEVLFQNITDPHFGENATKFRSITAIMIAGLYYLNLHSEINGSLFCGIDMKTEQGRDQIKEAISFLINQSYENL